jgi:citrate/tricarballylate utilization protein
MPPLEPLTRDASALAAGAPVLSEYESEVSRVMQICNACRYCEGFCAVFPAMTRRLEFGKADINYLANLCHDCGACLYSCQYATPHEFAVDVPRAMARVRVRTYAGYAWPRTFGALYARNGLTLTLAAAVGLALFLVLATTMSASSSLNHSHAGNFYAVFPHNLLVSMFAPIFLFAMLALAMGVRNFWKDVTPGAASRAAIGETTSNVLTMKYLDGGHGQGCNESDDAFTLWRRRFHHLTFYGFMLCFAATCLATLYHYLFGWSAPYALTSAPVLLGTGGGVGLLVGPIGLLWLNVRREPERGDGAQNPMDRGFIALLLLTSLSGLALLAWRDTGAMALLLALHLGVVMALFLTLPYGKFAHGFFRCAALLKWAIEKRQPSSLQLSDE